jgi:hypothetical protein
MRRTGQQPTIPRELSEASFWEYHSRGFKPFQLALFDFV